jgi:hypothetical protein
MVSSFSASCCASSVDRASTPQRNHREQSPAPDDHLSLTCARDDEHHRVTHACSGMRGDTHIHKLGATPHTYQVAPRVPVCNHYSRMSQISSTRK